MRLDRLAWITQGFMVCCLMAPGSVQAQIVPDGTLGAERSRVTPINPTTERIDGGAIRGTNLFHSFQEFSIGEGRGAYFANPTGIENILSRVTGRNPSNIFGTLGVLGNANLYLLNPNGIFFGPNARLDIRGSFTASTADSIVFSDRSLYSATDTQTKPLLTVVVPIGLQYGVQQAGAISNRGNLAVGQGQKMTLLGGTVTSTGQLTAPGGTVQVLGNQVALLDNARIDVSSATGGGTVLVGGDFQGKGEVPNAAQTFIAPGVTINADALTNGNGGRVIIWADDTTRFYGNISARGGVDSGNGGFVEVSGKKNLVYRGNTTTSAPNGQFGTLLLDPENITISATGGDDGQIICNGQNCQVAGDGSYTISTMALEALSGNAGIILQASNDIRINNSINFAPRTGAPGTGSITLEANADGIGGGDVVMLPGTSITTRGRNIEILGASLSLTDIDTSAGDTFGGDITLKATNGSLTAGLLDASNRAPDGAVNGAVIRLEAPGAIRLTGRNDKDNSVEGRSIFIDTPNTLSVDWNLNARNDSPDDAGDVRIGDRFQPSSVTIGGGISTRNLGGGNGGNVKIATTGLLRVNGSLPTAPDAPSQNNFSINSEAVGNGASINILASGGIQTAAGIVSSSRGTGDGGNITLNSSNGAIKVGYINSQAGANGGFITLFAFGDIDTDYINTAPSNLNQSAGVSLTSQTGSISVNGINNSILRDSILARFISINAPGNFFSAGDLNARSDNPGEQPRITIGEQQQPSSISTGILSARRLNNGDGGSIKIFTSGLLEVRDVSTRAGANILDQNVPIEDGFSIGTEASRNGGRIEISADGGIQTRGGIVSNSQGNYLIDPTNPNSPRVPVPGNGGDITLKSSNGAITVPGVIDASSHLVTGNGGNISFEAGGDITTGSIESIGQRGGRISLSSGGNFSINKNDIVSITTGQAQGGNIEFSARSITLTDARVANLTLGNGRSGDIVVKGSDSVNILNQGGFSSSSIGSPLFQILKGNTESLGQINGLLGTNIRPADIAKFEFQGSGILNTTGSIDSNKKTFGNAGDINVETSRLLIQANLGISKSSLTGISTATVPGSGGNGGKITITAPDSITIIGNNPDASIPGVSNSGAGRETAIKIQAIRTGITSATQGSGNAGVTTINTAQLSLSNGAAITTGVTNGGTGDGSDLTINARSIYLTGFAALATATLGSGKAGNLTINASDRLTLRDGALISADKVGTGLAGSVEINAGELLMTNRSRIGSSALISGRGGDLRLTIARSIQMKNIGDPQNATEIASNAFDDANGGNISILVGGQIRAKKGENNDIVATTERGKGGTVTVRAGGFIDFFINLNGPRTPENELSAASLSGINGVVNQDGNATQQPPPTQPVVREIPQVCPQGVTSRQAGRSEFMNTGRGGLPPNPGEALESNTAQVPWVTLEPEPMTSASTTSSQSSTPAPETIEEAQGWVRLPSGRVFLTTETPTAFRNPCLLRSSQP